MKTPHFKVTQLTFWPVFFLRVAHLRRRVILLPRGEKLPLEILTMHIFLMLKFYKAITPRFSSFRICYHFDLLDWPVGFEFSAQLGFACVVVDASNKQRSKGICGGLSVTLRVPQSNSLFQFVRHLFFFFPLFPLHPTQQKRALIRL